MVSLWQAFVKFFTSLKLTVTLLALSILLIFWATLAQVKLGIWGVQEHFFRTFFVLTYVKDIPLPVFPGGYFIGGLLLLNLIAAFLYRFKFTWKRSGLLLSHFGLILLLVGELLSGLWQQEFQMRLDEGETKNYFESYRDQELAIVDVTDPQWDEVVAIPDRLLAAGAPVQHIKLPFRIIPHTYYPNADVRLRGPMEPAAPASPADRDIGARTVVTPLPLTYRDDQRNLAAAHIELIGPEGSLGTWLVSTILLQPQSFDYAGRTWSLAMRFAREYKPFTLTLVDFSHDRYAGTEIPKNFSSKVRLQTTDGATDREVLIYMNNPLRFAGLTFYQQGFDNDDRTTVLQVVRNPSWQLPYAACLLMALGLLGQFGVHLFGFIAKRRTS